MPATKTFIYEEIVTRIAGMISDGTLSPGDKAPSLRRMSEKLGVSIASVMKAYTVLEEKGLLEALPQSGFYVSGMPQRDAMEYENPQTDPVRIEVTKGDLIASFAHTIENSPNRMFGCASPDPHHLPAEEMGKIIGSLARENREELINYQFPPGDERLRREIARRSIDWGCAISPRDLVITSGGLEAINFCLRLLCKPGDAVAIESPTYFGLLQAIENRNLQAIEIPTDPKTGVDLDVLEGLLERGIVKVCLFVPNFNNPLGSLMPEENKQRLAEMLERYDSMLVEDDIYGDVHFGKNRPRPVKAYDRSGRVMLCSGFSKTLSPGLRVGFMANERYVEGIKKLQFMTNVAVSTLPQQAIARFLTGGRYDRHLRRFRRALQADMNRYRDAVCNLFPKGTTMTCPKGGFLLWVALPEGKGGVTLYERALEHDISLAPGPMFTARKTIYQHHFRLNCAYPWSSCVERNLETLARLAHEL
ncbi:MAG: PLP-dependent aminotransferase family protein [Acidobacteriota bacterium]|nr:PLP-dependent aminotransferase family protein [Acidobacteriota bacterium]